MCISTKNHLENTNFDKRQQKKNKNFVQDLAKNRNYYQSKLGWEKKFSINACGIDARNRKKQGKLLCLKKFF